MGKHIYILIALILFNACTAHKNMTSNTINPTIQTDNVHKINNFSFDLVRNTCADKENVFLSPISANIALSMLIPGANGITQQQLNTIVSPCVLDTNTNLKTANSCWVSPVYPIKKSYLNKLSSSAQVFNFPFKASDINAWASEQTNGKINQVLSDPLPSNLALVLANAIYFKAEWEKQFPDYNTHTAPFHIDQHTTTQASFMEQTTHLRYYKDDLLQMVELPYKACENKHYCMDLILPSLSLSSNDLLQRMNDSIYQSCIQGLSPIKVHLTMPKFEIEYERVLNDDLQNMGLTTIFDPNNANFSSMSNVPLVVSMVKQKAYVKVDEVGTEAAAVSVVTVLAMSAAPRQEKIIEFNADRPFIIVIRDMHTNRILFVGNVCSPKL